MQRQIDCYGFEATSEHFQRRKLEAYLVKNDAGIIYECFGNGDPRPIHKIDHDPGGCVRVMWAYGRWADAENLAYIPINETMNIENRNKRVSNCNFQIKIAPSFFWNKGLTLSRRLWYNTCHLRKLRVWS